jgi:hypothetical protein
MAGSLNREASALRASAGTGSCHEMLVATHARESEERELARLVAALGDGAGQ